MEIASLAHLRLHDVATRMKRLRVETTLAGYDRRLRGCLIAYRGNGLILIDAHDPPDERRFILAHELAHFLIDYQAPRQRALEALGEAILPVLDGLRPPTLEERLHAVLEKRGREPRGVDQMFVCHLVGRETTCPDRRRTRTFSLQFSQLSPYLVMEVLDLNEAQQQRYRRAYDIAKHLLHELKFPLPLLRSKTNC